MPTRRVIVQLVVAFCVYTLPQCPRSQGYTNQPPTDLSDHPFTDGVNSTADFIMDVNSTDSPDFGPRANTDGPVVSTVQTPITPASDGCTCNVTPDFCDIGCCCDVVDCGIADLSSVFNNCRQETRAGVCIESWLMFRANVDPRLVTDTGSLFCVRSGNDGSAQTAPAASEGPFSIFSPHFSLAEVNGAQNPSIYKVDDVILTYYNTTSIASVLRQPSSGAASLSCVDRNPAKFLRSGSLSCSRVVSAQSCRRDSGLSFSSYFTGFSLLRVPRPSEMDISKIMIPVIPLVNPPELAEHNGSCMNVVTKVEYVITYTSAGEITAAAVKVNVTDASFGTQILQQHAVQFQLDTPSSPPKLPLVGLEVGTPVIGWFGGQPGPLTIPGLSPGGQCSTDLTNRAPILFTHNTITGCTFRLMQDDCSSLRAQLYSILRGTRTPDTVAMTAGSQPQQSRVVVQECQEPAPGEVCETGCLVPVSLSVRFLWAQTGTLALPQNHVLGIKYVFSCQILKCSIVSPLPLTTEVIFSDTTVYPEPPRAKPRPEWKFPFGFFSRGAEELDRA
ncbi:tectonic-3-like isoform X1 [Ictalurus furcatus]|uniref:tectonic-3-like isoform X1 n=1 Tax=Ictalurus furcatus TaxID=66913 RepID=UPI002350834F|nr:tectonic-3-like isoform X1 [Ictalurus furcatus]